MSEIIQDGFKIYAMYKLCGLCIIGLLLICIFARISYKNRNLLKWIDSNANITGSVCEQYNKRVNKKTVIRYKCNLDIEFVHNNNVIKTKHIVDDLSSPFNIGDNIKIKYNPKNPLDVMDKSGSNIVYIGGGVSIIGCIMFVIGCGGILYCMDNNCATLGGIFAVKDIYNR